jgi:hypothetical protein
VKSLSFVAAVVAALAFGVSVAVAGGPVTKQNGKTPVFNSFTSICAVPGYADFWGCNGDTTTHSEVTGKINAVQAKDGRWNLGFSFTHLVPGTSYRLWGNQTGATPTPGAVAGFFVIGESVAAADGTARFSYQTTDPSNLGFDLNTGLENITIATSYWSQQAIQVLNPDGTLYVPVL